MELIAPASELHGVMISTPWQTVAAGSFLMTMECVAIVTTAMRQRFTESLEEKARHLFARSSVTVDQQDDRRRLFLR